MPSVWWGQGHHTPLTTACAPPTSVYSQCFFGASRNDKTTSNNEKRNTNFSNINLVWSFLNCLQNCWPPTALDKCDPIIRLNYTLLRMCRKIEMHAYRRVTSTLLVIMIWNNSWTHFLKDELFFFWSTFKIYFRLQSVRQPGRGG